MRKIVSVVLMAVMLVSLSACGTKNTEGGSSPAPDAAVSYGSGGKLIVGTEAGFKPYEFMEGDKVVGVDMDISQSIADSLGKELEIQNMDFDGALAAVISGKIDFAAAGISVTEERKQSMDFSEPYVDSTEVIVVNKEKPLVTGAGDLDGKIIGVQQGNIADVWCTNPENVKAKEIRRYTKFVQAATDLQNNKIDCIVMDNLPALEMVAANDKLVIIEGDDNIVFQDQYAIAVKKGNDELLTQINTVIKDLKDSGKIDEYIAKYAVQK